VNAGAFSFDGVVSGVYSLETKPMSESTDVPHLVGRQVLSVGEDLNRIVLEMMPGIEARGKILVEGAPTSAWPQVSLQPTESLNYPDFASIDPNGDFVIPGLAPGSYNVLIGAPPSDKYVRAVRLNGQEYRSGTVDLNASASLEVVLADRSSSITGSVTDADGPVGSGITVIAHQRAAPGFLASIRTDETGHFSLVAMPPGEYVLTAVESGPVPLGFFTMDPSIEQKLGKPTTVYDGASVSVNLRLITSDELRAATER
jgi:hypothetical protein